MMALRKTKSPKIPKGFEPSYTTYELITKTSYDRPYKAPKMTKASKQPKAYVQPVRITNPGALKSGKGKRGK